MPKNVPTKTYAKDKSEAVKIMQKAWKNIKRHAKMYLKTFAKLCQKVKIMQEQQEIKIHGKRHKKNACKNITRYLR